MNQILTDILGLFKRNKVVKTGKNGDLIPLADTRSGSLGISGPKPSEAMTLITAEDFAQNYVGTTLGVAPKFLRFQTEDNGTVIISANYLGRFSTVTDLESSGALGAYQKTQLSYAWNISREISHPIPNIIDSTTTSFDAGNPDIITDTNVDFVASGVQVGDVFFSDNTGISAFVLSVDSPTQLTIGKPFAVGSTGDYTIYHPDKSLPVQKAINDALATAFSNKNTSNIIDVEFSVSIKSIDF